MLWTQFLYFHSMFFLLSLSLAETVNGESVSTRSTTMILEASVILHPCPSHLFHVFSQSTFLTWVSLLSLSKSFPTLPCLPWEVRTRTTRGNQQAGKPWICTVVLWYFVFWSVIPFLRILNICFALFFFWTTPDHWADVFVELFTTVRKYHFWVLMVSSDPTTLWEKLRRFPLQMCNIFNLSTLNFTCHFTSQPHNVHLQFLRVNFHP